MPSVEHFRFLNNLNGARFHWNFQDWLLSDGWLNNASKKTTDLLFLNTCTVINMRGYHTRSMVERSLIPRVLLRVEKRSWCPVFINIYFPARPLQKHVPRGESPIHLLQNEGRFWLLELKAKELLFPHLYIFLKWTHAFSSKLSLSLERRRE